MNWTRARVAVAGLGTESCTFAPHRMTLDEFTVHRGPEVATALPFVGDGTFAGVEWLPGLHARGVPSGPILPEVYDALETELLQRLADAGPVDGVLLDLHGAMAVEGRTGCEEGLVARVREVVGPSPLISLAMDPHGNLSFELARLVDFAACHRLSPHRDEHLTRLRAARVLVEAIRANVRPVGYWVDVPLLLNGERTSTDVEPGASVFAAAATAAEHSSVIDAGIWIGFGWADEVRCRGAVLVTGTEPAAVKHTAEGLAEKFWGRRREFQYVSPRWGSFGEALNAAHDHVRASPESGPFVISDSGDNVTAGAPGDATHSLRELLASSLAQEGRSVLYAGIPDAAAARQCLDSGVGAHVALELGGHLETRHGEPIRASATVRAVVNSPGRGTSALLDLDGVQVIVSDRRNGWTNEHAFTELGVDTAGLGVLVVKNGYLFPFQRRIASDWFLAITPGATDLDHTRLGYHSLTRPLFPFDDEEASLTARLTS